MRRATRHSAALIGAFVATAILNYAFGVAMSWFFTPAQYGVLGVAQSLLLLAGLAVGSGFAWTTAHQVAGSGVTDETRRRFRTAWLANVGLGLVAGGGAWGAYAAGWLSLGPAYSPVMPLLGVTTILLAARSVVNGAVQGLFRFDALAVNRVGEVVVKAVAGLALVVVGMGVAGVVAGFALGAAIALAHSLWVARRAHLWRGRGWLDWNVIPATMPLYLGMLGTALMLNLDILGLKFFAPAGTGDELAGFYQAAVILARTPVFVAQSLTPLLFSYAAGASGQAVGGAQETRNYVREALQVWLRLLLPSGLMLVVAPGSALTLLFPDHYQAAAPALRVAAMGAVLLALVTLLVAVFQAAGDRRRPAIAAGMATVVQIGVLAWLVPQWGTLGAAVSLLTAGGLALLGLLPGLVPHLPPLLAGEREQLWPGVWQTLLPLLALVLPLVLLPDGGRGMALLKFSLAGLLYVSTLMAVHPWAPGDSKHPLTNVFNQFVETLIGVDR
jgi:O-antigen/teichoic acid export membrane protein